MIGFRRTCAKLCRKNGGDLEQIKFLLGHSSILIQILFKTG
jgi:integrase